MLRSRDSVAKSAPRSLVGRQKGWTRVRQPQGLREQRAGGGACPQVRLHHPSGPTARQRAGLPRAGGERCPCCRSRGASSAQPRLIQRPRGVARPRRAGWLQVPASGPLSGISTSCCQARRRQTYAPPAASRQRDLNPHAPRPLISYEILPQSSVLSGFCYGSLHTGFYSVVRY